MRFFFLLMLCLHCFDVKVILVLWNELESISSFSTLEKFKWSMDLLFLIPEGLKEFACKVILAWGSLVLSFSSYIFHLSSLFYERFPQLLPGHQLSLQLCHSRSVNQPFYCSFNCGVLFLFSKNISFSYCSFFIAAMMPVEMRSYLNLRSARLHGLHARSPL